MVVGNFDMYFFFVKPETLNPKPSFCSSVKLVNIVQ
jgi:hypothetical protein